VTKQDKKKQNSLEIDEIVVFIKSKMRNIKVVDELQPTSIALFVLS
jgi:hypothetical protein